MCDFIPYIEPIHGWKYSPQNYYKHILQQYNQLNPNKSHKDAYNYLQNNINTYLDHLESNMRIPWQSSSFANVWSNITKNKFDGLEHKTYNQPNMSSALYLLNIILNKLQQYEIFDLLNKCSSERNKYPLNINRVPWGDCIKAALSIPQFVHELNGHSKHEIAIQEKQTTLT